MTQEEIKLRKELLESYNSGNITLEKFNEMNANFDMLNDIEKQAKTKK